MKKLTKIAIALFGAITLGLAEIIYEGGVKKVC